MVGGREFLLVVYIFLLVTCFLFFFFKQKTAYEIVDCDWSSDVCSSDLIMKLGALLILKNLQQDCTF